MAAATAIEKIVLQALVAKGYTPSEASVVIAKLRETTKFDGTAAIEISSDGKYVAIADVTCLHKTAKKDEKAQGAILVNCKGHEYWIPTVQVAPMSEVTEVGDKGILVIKKWIAEQKGFVVNGAAVKALP
jgi:Holliday junction resolvasome RuvABC DNA-binding subunit